MEVIHRTLATMALLYTFIGGLWGLVLFVRRRPPDSSFNGVLVIAEGLFVLQGIVGIILVFVGHLPDQGIHFLYGVSTLLTLPLAFTLTRGRNDTRASLIYGLAFLFLWGLALRAVGTAGPG